MNIKLKTFRNRLLTKLDGMIVTILLMLNI